MRILVTGGAGFIGSALARYLVAALDWPCLVVDKLTYAANLRALEPIQYNDVFSWVQADICDAPSMRKLLYNFQPDAILHLAAESHVDRSIDDSADFIQTNVVGTHTLLTETLSWWKQQGSPNQFRFLHVSTDEVYGSLHMGEPAFQPSSPYRPNSPYSASKAASDHLVRAWNRTYGLPTLITHCSNNYGEFQHQEKLIPTVIRTALSGQSIPIYGDGRNRRDWLYVGDHVEALIHVLRHGQPGSTYMIGGGEELSNLDLVHAICSLLDEHSPRTDSHSYSEQISFVEDRLGHDFRYAIDTRQLWDELGWRARTPFAQAILRTILWYQGEYNEGHHFGRRQRDSSLSSDTCTKQAASTRL